MKGGLAGNRTVQSQAVNWATYTKEDSGRLFRYHSVLKTNVEDFEILCTLQYQLY